MLGSGIEYLKECKVDPEIRKKFQEQWNNIMVEGSIEWAAGILGEEYTAPKIDLKKLIYTNSRKGMHGNISGIGVSCNVIRFDFTRDATGKKIVEGDYLFPLAHAYKKFIKGSKQSYEDITGYTTLKFLFAKPKIATVEEFKEKGPHFIEGYLNRFTKTYGKETTLDTIYAQINKISEPISRKRAHQALEELLDSKKSN